jgi:hypothetical protein
MAQLEQERLSPVWVAPEIKLEFKLEAVREGRPVTRVAADALKLYLAMKSGAVTVVRASEEN